MEKGEAPSETPPEAKLLLTQTISGFQERDTSSLSCSLHACRGTLPAGFRRLVAKEPALGAWQEDITEGYQAQSPAPFQEKNE